MATTKLYLDARVIRQNGCVPLVVVLRNRRTSSRINLGVSIPPLCWDGSKVVLSKDKDVDSLLIAKPAVLNNLIQTKMAKINLAIAEICPLKSSIHAADLRDRVLKVINGESRYEGMSDKTLLECFDEYLESLEKDSSRGSISVAKSHIERAYKRAYDIRIADVDEEWLRDYISILKNGNERAAPVAQNTASNYYSYFKAMWRFARRKKYVSQAANPFDGISIPKKATRSRALEVEDARRIWFYGEGGTSDQGEIDSSLEVARDMFKLIVCLCGINMADLNDLKLSDIRSGRLETDRRKTGVHINIKIEPEAEELINKYQKNGYLIGKIRYDNAKSTSEKINKALGRLIPGLTIYWARHTWASLAVELDIPDRVVFMGLAHKQGNYSDETYITMRHRKLDKANRRVIDYILGIEHSQE